ncbi:MAG: hypothetical protein B6D41_19920 [Chloroflexi bacterium UTCFX4]|nr:MAG: hypothetical protein B6D41_19920 [Chloroflexi bacterium UTCFX4]
MYSIETVSKIVVPHLTHELALDDAAAWRALPALDALFLADGSRPAAQQTRVRVGYDANALYARFDCDDRDIWGTYTQRDEPLYEQEAVELFIAPGAADPREYFEFQISPNGVLFDAIISNPTARRDTLQTDPSWQCPGIRWMARRDDAHRVWWGALALPWVSITHDGKIPPVCRANFYRIERPHDSAVEYSCWAPTFTEPADFHKPARFGFLEFAAA